MIEFEVLGLPAPQGSKRHVGNGVMIESSKAVKPWRQAVNSTAREHADRLEDGPLDGPLILHVTFRLPMPKSRKKALRVAGIGPSTTKPDLSKLVRSTEDALTDSGLIADDARIHTIVATKVEVIGWTGATIRIETQNGAA